MKKFLIITVVVFIFFFWMPPFYFGSSLSGKVVDEESDEPISDLIVVADWELRTGFLETHPAGPIHIVETITNQNGEFHFDSWGPKINKVFHSIHEEDPLLILFKDGYEVKVIRGSSLFRQHFFPYAISSLGYKTYKIKMHKYSRSKDSSLHLSNIYTSLSVFYERNCDWRKIKKFLKEYETVRNKVIDKNKRKKWHIQSIYEIPVIKGKCDHSELRNF